MNYMLLQTPNQKIVSVSSEQKSLKFLKSPLKISKKKSKLLFLTGLTNPQKNTF